MSSLSWVANLTAFAVELAWKAGVIVLLAGAIAIVPRVSAAMRHATWTAAAVALLLLPLAILFGPRRLTGAPFSGIADLTVALGGVVPFGMRTGDVLVVGADGPHIDGTASLDDPVTGTGLATSDRPAWIGALLVFLAGVVLVQAGRLLHAHRFQRAVIEGAGEASDSLRQAIRAEAARLGMKHVPALLVSGRIGSPMAAGVSNACVVLPGPWAADPEVTRQVLLHELAHVRRRDNLRQLITEVAAALYCWHPLAWWLVRQSRLQREYAADDVVLAAGIHPAAYARTLVDRTRAAQIRVPGALQLSGSTLHRRVTRVLGGMRSTADTRWHIRIAVFAILCCTLTLAAIWPSGDHRRAASSASFTGRGEVPRVGARRTVTAAPAPAGRDASAR